MTVSNNTIKTNILNENFTKGKINSTLDILTEVLSKTLGPYGSTTILEDKMYGHVITKDGYTVLKNLKFDDSIANVIHEFIKNISRKLVREVGDGSTTSVVASATLFKEIEHNIIENNNIPRKDIVDLLSGLEKIVEKEIKSNSKPVSKDLRELKYIAGVANNNDDRAGELIFEIFSKIGIDGFITLENSLNELDHYEILKGYELPRGYINPIYANKINKEDCILEDPYVLICNDKLDEKDLEFLSDTVGNICLKRDAGLLIIAGGFDNEVKNFFHINKLKNKSLDIVPVDYSLMKTNNLEILEDLALYVGADIYNKKNGVMYSSFEDVGRLGRCKKIIVNSSSTKVIEGINEKEKIKERIESVQTRIDELRAIEGKEKVTLRIFELKNRIASLTSSNAVLYVGGKSELEKNTRKYLMEDAVFACQSTLKNGYIYGGNLIIPKIINKSKDIFVTELSEKFPLVKKDIIESLIETVKHAFLEPFIKVLSNTSFSEDSINSIIEKVLTEDVVFNVKTMEYEQTKNTKIINSANTDIEIMKASFSIIGLLVTSNQFISLTVQ